jgi:hypothetical protein
MTALLFAKVNAAEEQVSRISRIFSEVLNLFVRDKKNAPANSHQSLPALQYLNVLCHPAISLILTPIH